MVVGSWQVFMLALLLIAAWAASGPFFGFSDTWQLVINTSTTIVTFLLGILILLEANRQAKESKVVHDELIQAVKGARNRLINIDEMSEADVDEREAGLRCRATRIGPNRRRASAAHQSFRLIGRDPIGDRRLTQIDIGWVRIRPSSAPSPTSA